MGFSCVFFITDWSDVLPLVEETDFHYWSRFRSVYLLLANNSKIFQSTSSYWRSAVNTSRTEDELTANLYSSTVVLRSIDFYFTPWKRLLSFETSNRRLEKASLSNPTPQVWNIGHLFWHLKIISLKRYRIHKH